MKIKLLIVFLLIFPFVVNFSTTSSYACSCIQPGTAEEGMDRSDFVFSGKVIEIQDSNANLFSQSSADLLEVHFEVSSTWKGVNETEVLVYTERESASCGFNFTIEVEYLVYGNEHDGKNRVSLCSKTSVLSDAAADLNALGEGQKPSEVVDIKEKINKENSMGVPITIFAVVVVLIILSSYLLVKRNATK